MPDPENVRFRGADLRGANLEGASLADADLSEIRTGMRTGWIVAMCALALAVSIGLGVLAGLGAKYLGQLLESGDSRNVALALNAYAALAVLIVAALWKGGDFALRVVVPVITAMFLAMTGIAVATGVGRGAGLFVALGALFLGTAVIALGALARAVAGTAGNSMFVAVAVAGGLAGGLVGGGVLALALAISAVLIGRQLMKGSDRYPRLARFVVEIAVRRGTRFRGADLSRADFTGALLTHCDFRGANLSGARLDRAKKVSATCLFDGPLDVGATSTPSASP